MRRSSGGRPHGWAGLAPFLVAALLAQGGFRLLMRPGKVEAIRAASDEAARLRLRLDAGADAGALEASRLAGELAGVSSRVAALRGTLARDGEAEAVLHALASLAAEEGVRFRRFAPGAETRLDRYTARAATVAAEGGFFDFVDFFERVALLPHLVLIEEVQFEAVPDGFLRSRFVAVTVGGGEGEGAEPPLPTGASR